MEQQYKCPRCGNVVIEMDMIGAVLDGGGDDESYSDYSCPKCETWFADLEDWIKVDDREEAEEEKDYLE